MDSLEKNTETIITYLQNELSESGISKVEAWIKKDHEFKEEVEYYRKILSGLKGLKLDELESQMPNWDKELDQAVVKSLYIKIAISAAVTALILISNFLILKPHKYDQIVANNYNLALGSNLMGDNTQQELANQAYLGSDFDTVILLLEPIVDSLSPEMLTLLGHSYFGNADYEQAISIFDMIRKKGKISYLINEAEWNLLISYIANRQFDKSFQELIGKIRTDPNHPYQTRAETIFNSKNSLLGKIANFFD